MRLLSFGSDPKTEKSNALGEFATVILYLQPDALLCPVSYYCREFLCLHWAGNLVYLESKIKARKRKTELWHRDRDMFKKLLLCDMESFLRYCDREDRKPCFRLNGTSDIVWEFLFPELFDRFKDCQFYDYTKLHGRLRSNWKLPSNYDLTLSWSGYNADECFEHLSNYGKVAIPFAGYGRVQLLPSHYRGFPVVDGDSHDLTFKRPSGHILGLRAKGKARSSLSPFIVRPIAENRFKNINAIRSL